MFTNFSTPEFFLVIIEFVVFVWALKKYFKLEISFLKSSLIILIANLIIPLIGFIIDYLLGGKVTDLIISMNINLIFYLGITLLISFVLSVFVEWGVYILFLLKEKISKKDLFLISLFVNMISHIILAGLFFLALIFLGSMGTF